MEIFILSAGLILLAGVPCFAKILTEMYLNRM